jgi:hypothetical protein
MRKVEEYKQHADDCRQLATRSSNEEARTQLLQMAETWEGLARQREEQIAREGRITALEANEDGGAT